MWSISIDRKILRNVKTDQDLCVKEEDNREKAEACEKLTFKENEAIRKSSAEARIQLSTCKDSSCFWRADASIVHGYCY